MLQGIIITVCVLFLIIICAINIEIYAKSKNKIMIVFNVFAIIIIYISAALYLSNYVNNLHEHTLRFNKPIEPEMQINLNAIINKYDTCHVMTTTIDTTYIYKYKNSQIKK